MRSLKVAVFDIETVENPELLDLAVACAKQRAARREETAIEIDEEAVRAEMTLSPIFGHIVAVGVLDADFDDPLVAVGGDERELLRRFWHWMGGFELFISWNGLSFDLPWLYVRSMVRGVPTSVRISAARYRYPGESNHVDLFALLTDWRGNRTRHLKLDLSTVCKALGVKPPVGAGVDVPALWEQGDLDAIRQHLESDLKATLALWRRLGCPGLNPRSSTPSGLPF